MANAAAFAAAAVVKYGILSNNLENLLMVIEIKIMAKELLIKKIDDTSTGFVLEFKINANLDVTKVELC